MNALRSERGSVVLGGLTKLIVLAALAVVVYDAVAIGYCRYTTANHGGTAAETAAESWRETHDVTKAYEVATHTLEGTYVRIDPASFAITTDDTVSFEVRTTAPTLLAQHVSFTRHWTEMVVHIQVASAAPGP